MYKNACRFMQRSGFHVRMHETAVYGLSLEDNHPLRVGRVQSAGSQPGKARASVTTAMAEAMRRAGVSRS